MTTGQMLWAGLCCSVASLVIQLFPGAAFALGVDVGATWRLFAFGIFLIAVAFLAASTAGGRRG